MKTQLYVGAVVQRDGEVLLVRQSPGHSLAGQWTIPWGHVDAGESPMAAALREVLEEGGVEATVEGLLGVQELPAPLQGGVGLVYLCRHAGGDLRPRDRETDASRYVSLATLDAMTEPKEPWSDWLIRRFFAGTLAITRIDDTNPLQRAGSFL
ncbi:MAG TPA: NUDIX domain-containing protein [Vicinamibacterales bacterium]|nr:NUDIX domain-containing protein [Vicinamibacterales bacterium]